MNLLTGRVTSGDGRRLEEFSFAYVRGGCSEGGCRETGGAGESAVPVGDRRPGREGARSARGAAAAAIHAARALGKTGPQQDHLGGVPQSGFEITKLGRDRGARRSGRDV